MEIVEPDKEKPCTVENETQNPSTQSGESPRLALAGELAGRELDAAIAVRVMGWALTRRGGEGKYRDSMYWKGAPDKGSRVDWHWRPSIEIAAAMEVVERMAHLGVAIIVRPYVMNDDQRGRYRVCAQDETDNEIYYTKAMSFAELPAAICRAALTAVNTQPTDTPRDKNSG